MSKYILTIVDTDTENPGTGKAHTRLSGTGFTDLTITIRDENGNEYNLQRIFAPKAITNADSPYTLGDRDGLLLIDATSGAVTVNLPAGANARREPYWFKSVDSTSAVTIEGNGSENIDGSLNFTLATNEVAAIEWDGTEWKKLVKAVA